MEAVLVAIIAAIGGILAALVQKGRKENREDHNVVANLLHVVHQDVKTVENKIDNHINWHLEEKK